MGFEAIRVTAIAENAARSIRDVARKHGLNVESTAPATWTIGTAANLHLVEVGSGQAVLELAVLNPLAGLEHLVEVCRGLLVGDRPVELSFESAGQVIHTSEWNERTEASLRAQFADLRAEWERLVGDTIRRSTPEEAVEFFISQVEKR